MAQEKQQLEELLEQNYVVTSVHRETTGDFHIRFVYAGEDQEKKGHYRSLVTRDQETVNRANEIMLQSGSCCS